MTTRPDGTDRVPSGTLSVWAFAGGRLTPPVKVRIRRPTHLGSNPHHYPIQYNGHVILLEDLVIDNADRHGIPPQFLMSQVFHESSGNSYAFRYEATSVDFKSLTGDRYTAVVGAGPTNEMGATRHLLEPTEGFFNLGIRTLEQDVRYLPCETSTPRTGPDGEPTSACIAGQTPTPLETNVPVTMTSATTGSISLQPGEFLYADVKVYPTGGDPLQSPFIQIVPFVIGPWPGTSYTVDIATGILTFTAPQAGSLAASLRRLHPGQQPYQASPIAAFGSSISNLADDIRTILSHNNGSAVPPLNPAMTIRQWSLDGRGNAIAASNCMSRYDWGNQCGANLWWIVQHDGAFEVPGQWLAASSYGLLQIIPNSLNDKLKSSALAGSAAHIRTNVYNPGCGLDTSCAANNNPVAKLFNPSICVPLASLMDATSNARIEGAAPLALDDPPGNQVTEPYCVGDPTPSLGQCTWERVWKRRFRVFNGGSQTSVGAVPYADAVVSESNRYLPH
ncbi:MAG: hypothetical protein IT186_02355 [Acidobacteria bacterium]|nr:hypothetical protein [Acidobacteriota bacterium]